MVEQENKKDGGYKSKQRSGRFYYVKNEWFFSVREKEDQGPYSSKVLAELGLKEYLINNVYHQRTDDEVRIPIIKMI